MRWDCPHCQTKIQAEVDLKSERPLYVRCGACHEFSRLSIKTPIELPSPEQIPSRGNIPPPFLIQKNEKEVITPFSTLDSESIPQKKLKQKLTPAIHPLFTWVALAAALFSGYYLFNEVRKINQDHVVQHVPPSSLALRQR